MTLTSTHLIRTSGALAATAALALTAACGSSSSGSAASGGSAGSSSSGSSSSDASGDTAAVQLTKSNLGTTLAAAQKKAGTYSFTINVDAAGAATKGSGQSDLRGSKPALTTNLTLGGQKFSAISTDGLIYVKGAAFGSDKWVKVDPTDKTGIGASFSGSSDPGAQLKLLSGASSVTKGDSEKVGGVDTTEYDVSIPASAFTQANPALKQLASALPKTIEYDLFVDKDNLVRKLTNELAIGGQKIDIDILFSDYGKPVSIKAPPASQTTTAPVPPTAAPSPGAAG